MKFMCPHHRTQVLRSPGSAKKHWEDWMRSGAQARLDKRWRQAIAFLGCSFEVADWLLATPELVAPAKTLTHVDRYLMAGHELAQCLEQTGQADMQLHVLLTVHRRLLGQVRKNRAGYWRLADSMHLSTAALHHYCDRHGPFRGYRDCLEETQGIVARCLN